MQTIANQLEQAWLDRWNQRIENSLRGLADVQVRMGWDELVPEQILSHSDGPAEYLDALLLKGSLLRAQGARKKSSVLLNQTQIAWKKTHLQKPFRLLFELGLDHWIDQDIANAIECFLLAEKKAETHVQKIFTRSNILWCLEALDLDRREMEKTLLQDLNEMSTSERAECQHVVELWNAYKLRADFYQKMSLPVFEKEEFVGQAHFFIQWGHLLPYTQLIHSKINLNLTQDYLWQGSYRMRTLARIWIPADEECVRVSDAIDRFYLWTWLFMSGSSEMTKEKVIFTLKSLLNDFEFENQAKENLLLLRNALGWSLLLFSAMKSKVEKIYQRLCQVNSSTYDVLEAEYNLILHLSMNPPLEEKTKFYKKFLSFEIIFNDLENHLPVLYKKLIPLIEDAHHYTLIIDEGRNELILPAESKIVCSKGLTQFLTIIEINNEVHSELAHELDIANLIYRARKLFGTKSIDFRHGVVSRGQDWPKTLIVKDINLSGLDAPEAKISLVNSQTHLQAAKALMPDSFKRQDLEKKLNISKASANRMIEAWLSEGKITAVGRARAINYFWSQT